jgi:hypothetical protein
MQEQFSWETKTTAEHAETGEKTINEKDSSALSACSALNDSVFLCALSGAALGC